MLDRYAKIIEWTRENYPNADIFGSLSPNQIESKRWLASELYRKVQDHYEDVDHRIEVVGSWYGWPLLEHLFRDFYIDKIECWDFDKEARMIHNMYAEIFDVKDKVSIYSKDYWEHRRNGSEATILINCSSEHMVSTFDDMAAKNERSTFYVKNPIIAIQSNDMRHIEDHINCCDSVDELVNKHRLNTVYYRGEKPIMQWEDSKIIDSRYKRFMVIGRLQ